MTKVKSYLSLIKFAHTIFAMPFALIGFFIALNTGQHLGLGNWNSYRSAGSLFDSNSHYSADSLLSKLMTGANPYTSVALYFLLVILCMVFARSAAMAFNRYLDRRWDALNPRTAIREIPKGIITPKKCFDIYHRQLRFVYRCNMVHQ